ncbi:MAG: competence/damage-inducible protein A [Deltaproteobacteria bacterium]|nr:competence/damage-inducible protein A [Deltaproteobacteria bacterium]
MKKHDLLTKTELKIEKILLHNANLTEIAAQVAEILNLNRDEVLVVDYHDASLTLDILNTCVNAYNIVGKKQQLLNGLGRLRGVSVSAETGVYSDGMLGWIAMDQEPALNALRRSEQMAAEIRLNISRRVMVFSTGTEVAQGQIEDTNTPAIMQYLAAAGYKVTQGETLKDDRLFLAARLREVAEYGGYGLIVTTGGVGAEEKDHTVEAIRDLDPEAATPYICHFKIGTGRHVKDGIKIAVGLHNDTLVVALPGPNDEVMASLSILVEGLKARLDKHLLAENLAANLREILRKKTIH